MLPEMIASQETAVAAERESVLPASRILIVDDEETNTRLLARLLSRDGYTDLHATTDSRVTLQRVQELAPDLILLDLQMPFVTGFQVLEQLQRVVPETTYLPVLVLTADITPEARHRAWRMGAKDFLTKPFDAAEVLLRVRNLLETRRLHLQLQRQNEELEDRVRERTRELEEAQLEILRRLAQAAEFRDDDTGHHTHRVGELAALIAGSLGLPDDEVELIRRAAPLHDVGKIGIPDAILLKPGRLTPEELGVMKTHTRIGAKLLAGGRSSSIRLAEQIALAHHERWDGSGYPQGLAGEAIPLAARIVALADFYDALSHDRPYRKAWKEADVLAEIEGQVSLHFDPQVVAAFTRIRASGKRRLRISNR